MVVEVGLTSESSGTAGAIEIGGGSGAGFQVCLRSKCCGLQVVCEDRGIATLGGGGGGGAYGRLRRQSGRRGRFRASQRQTWSVPGARAVVRCPETACFWTGGLWISYRWPITSTSKLTLA